MTTPGLQGWRIAVARELNGAVSQVKTGRLVTQAGEEVLAMQIDDSNVVVLGLQAMAEHIAHCRAESDLAYAHNRDRDQKRGQR